MLRTRVHGPWLDYEPEVSIGHDRNYADGVLIYGDSVKVKTGASIFNIHYNELTNNGTIMGSECTPLALSLDTTVPAFSTPASGAEDHEIPEDGSLYP